MSSRRIVHFVARDRIECAERLIHEQDIGVIDQRPADRDSLPHSARQLVRTLIFESGEPYKLDEGVGAIDVFGPRPP